MTRCAVLGAAGYVGTRLVAELTARGHQVRAMARGGGKWPGGVEPVEGDVRDPAAVASALDGVEVAYYLVHSLADADFAAVDRAAAATLAEQASGAGVRQLVYLGGIRPRDGEVSAHLASRAEVGDILLAGAVPALVLQASMIVGAGSASFEILRRTVPLSPLLLRPSWMRNRSQPIAIADVLHYLTAAAELTGPVHGAFDIGGPQLLSYHRLVQRYARIAGLPVRLPVPVPLPLWSHRLAGAAVGALTPVPAAVAESLLRSLEHDLPCADHEIARHIPDPPGGLTSFDRAVRQAGVDPERPPPGEDPFVDDRSVRTEAGPGRVWDVITGVGGDRGWHTVPLVWTVRGAIDQLLGGAGLHRGRPGELRPGDAVDSWTVEERDDERRLLVLRADLKMPGTARLRMSAEPDGAGAIYRQTVTFDSSGLGGTAYWYLQKPVHDLVFGLMAANIARRA
ncbi:DUF2867 domain-containing protein [Amycolatopsis nigrescens]|uniref:DUF2867 domain-containing protein n=1 Tax=Amycolatopsis nigrescens TaxID=381445 RepID=UPI00037C1D2B|nr:DUF2867 domain-containing protein [Amycolatopsis nigrescens]